MARERWRLASAFVAAASLGPAPDAHACSCARSGPCIELDEAPVVFVGLVTSVQNRAGAHRAHFRVEERVRGIETATVDVDTGTRTSCGLSFANGVRYLVRAWPQTAESWVTAGRPFGRPAALATGYCSRTRRLADGRDDLDLLHARSQGRPLTRAFGVARSIEQRPTADPHLSPVAGATVVASGSAGRFEAKTDTEGRYRFDNLAQGTYTLGVLWPAGYRDYMGAPHVNATTIEILAPVCGVERDFAADSEGKKPASR